MVKPLHPLAAAPVEGGPLPHELDLDGMTAGSWFRIGAHMFMAQRMNLTTVARAPRRGEDPVRDLDEIDMRLVHIWWKCCE